MNIFEFSRFKKDNLHWNRKHFYKFPKKNVFKCHFLFCLIKKLLKRWQFHHVVTFLSCIRKYHEYWYFHCEKRLFSEIFRYLKAIFSLLSSRKHAHFFVFVTQKRYGNVTFPDYGNVRKSSKISSFHIFSRIYTMRKDDFVQCKLSTKLSGFRKNCNTQ